MMITIHLLFINSMVIALCFADCISPDIHSMWYVDSIPQDKRVWLVLSIDSTYEHIKKWYCKRAILSVRVEENVKGQQVDLSIIMWKGDNHKYKIEYFSKKNLSMETLYIDINEQFVQKIRLIFTTVANHDQEIKHMVVFYEIKVHDYSINKFMNNVFDLSSFDDNEFNNTIHNEIEESKIYFKNVVKPQFAHYDKWDMSTREHVKYMDKR